MDFIKHFCRLITEQDISDDDVIEYFDIVQSVVPVKLVTGHTDNEQVVSVEVTEYTDDNGLHVYEIVLHDQINLDEGEQISDLLAEEFEFDFDFETSMEI